MKKDYGTAILLAIFLGGLGAHKFYLNKAGMGFLYLVFCWTFVPAIIALLEGIVMAMNGKKAFDRQYNSAYQEREEDFHKDACPYCSESIQADAIKCKHCDSRLDTKEAQDIWWNRFQKEEKLEQQKREKQIERNKKRIIVVTIFIVVGAIILSQVDKSGKNDSRFRTSVTSSVLRSDQELKNYLREKFSQSSGSTVSEVSFQNNNIYIVLSPENDLNSATIDVAIVLNRHPNFSFDTVIISNTKDQVSFTKELFETYRLGQIRDLEFIELLDK